jgi:hypothetical protein
MGASASRTERHPRFYLPAPLVEKLNALSTETNWAELEFTNNDIVAS